MRRRKKTPEYLFHRFHTTCGWCRRKILRNTKVFGRGGKAWAGVDLTSLAGQIVPIYLVSADKTAQIAISGLDSEARRQGKVFVYMTCSESCALSLKSALESDIEIGKRLPSL